MALASLAVALFVLAPTSPAAAESPRLVGQVPSAGGLAMVVWSGGPVDELATALAGDGCHPASVWAAGSTRLVGYVFGAPSQVNGLFSARFPGGSLPGNSAVIVVCRSAAQLASNGTTPTTAPRTTASPPPPADAPSVPGVPGVDTASEARMLALVNQERAANGLPAFVLDARLTEVARAHSADMRDRDFFAHTDPGGLSPFDRMKAAGISFGWAAENIAWGPGVEWAHQGLMTSPGHRANILNPELLRIGIGIVGPANGQQWFTQAFTD